MDSQTDSQFPLSNAAYDIIVIIHEKSKAIQAYGTYLADLQHDTALRQALVEIRHDEQRHVDKLKSHLPRLLSSQRQTEEQREPRDANDD
jgi:hypothetical protein